MNENNDTARKISKIDTLSEAEKEKYERGFREQNIGSIYDGMHTHHHSSGTSGASAGTHRSTSAAGTAQSGAHRSSASSGTHHSSSTGAHHSSSTGTHRSSSSSSSQSHVSRTQKKTKKTNKTLVKVGKVASFVLVTVAAIVVTAFLAIKMICGSTSPSAKRMFVTTMLETGQMKGFASLFLTDDEVNQLVKESSLTKFEGEIDTSLIVVSGDSSHESGQSGESGESGTKGTTNGIETKTITGRTFSATMMIVKDPSRLAVGCIDQFGTYGKTLAEICEAKGAVAGINAGLYYSTNNSGGTPYGVVVESGVIRRNIPNEVGGLYLIGMTEDNILVVIDMAGKTAADMEAIISERHIRDAISWQEEATEKNNHFVSLIINGESRQMSGYGSGMNPRTAIGQRADGAMLLLVTDGRGTNGHLGASAADLISIMEEYGAVNAVNLDGGSSSCMYYDHAYLRDSVTFYYRNTTWRMPYAFIVN